jgi:cyclic beta-1,2-glucan synthetase
MPTPGTDTAQKLTLQARDGAGELALELAQKFIVSCHPALRFPIPAQLNLLEQDIQAAHQHFEAAAREKQPDISPAAEWLLDNFHIVRQAFQQIRIGLPADYYSRLPKVNLENGSELARVYLLASALTRFYESRLDAENITSFVLAYQTVAPLKIGEIWAIALMLRLSILEMLAASLANIRQISFSSTYLLPVFQFDTGDSTEIHPAARR